MEGLYMNVILFHNRLIKSSNSLLFFYWSYAMMAPGRDSLEG